MGNLAAQTGMGAMPMVAVYPVRQLLGAFSGMPICPRISPCA